MPSSSFQDLSNSGNSLAWGGDEALSPKAAYNAVFAETESSSPSRQPQGHIAVDDDWVFFGRPNGGGIGGMVGRAWDKKSALPYDAPTGSGDAGIEVGRAGFRSLNTLVVKYVDSYLEGLTNRNTIGSSTVTATGTDGMGAYTFHATISYDFLETGSPAATFVVDDTAGFTYDFYETGTAADGTSFTLFDTGAATLTITGGGGGGGSAGGGGPGGGGLEGGETGGGGSGGGSNATVTLSGLLSGWDEYTLIEISTLSGNSSGADLTLSDSFRHIGSNGFSYHEDRTALYSSGGAFTAGTNSSTWDESGTDIRTHFVSSRRTAAISDAYGEQSSSESSTDSGSGTSTHSMHYRATDMLGGSGMITSGNRGFTWTVTDSAQSNSSSTLVGNAMLVTGDSLGHSISALEAGTASFTTRLVGTESYSASLGGGAYTWDETGSDTSTASGSSSRSSTMTALSSSSQGGLAVYGAEHSTLSHWAETSLSGSVTQSLHQVGSEFLSDGIVSTGTLTATWRETATVTDDGSTTDSLTVTATVTEASTIGGVTRSLTQSSTETDALIRDGIVITATTNTETDADAYSGGFVAGGSVDLTLTSTPVATLTITDRNSSTIGFTGSVVSALGGVARSANSSGLRRAYSTLTETVTSSAASTQTIHDALSGGGIILSETATATATETDHSTSTLTSTLSATSTATAIESSNLAGLTLHTTLTAYALENASSSESGTDTGSSASASTITFSGGEITAARSSNDAHSTSTHTEISSSTGSLSSTTSATFSSSSGGLNTTGTRSGLGHGGSSGSATSTETTTLIQGDDLTLGLAGVITGGGSDTTLLATGRDTITVEQGSWLTETVTSTVSSALGGITASTRNLGTNTAGSQVTETDTDTWSSTGVGNSSFGAGGLASSSVQSSDRDLTGTATAIALSTMGGLSTGTTTESSTNGGVTSSATATVTESSSYSNLGTSTLTSTEAETSSLTYGSYGLVSSGGASQSLTVSGTGSSAPTSTFGNSYNSTGSNRSTLGGVSRSATETASGSMSTTIGGTSSETSSDSSSSTIIYGVARSIVSGSIYRGSQSNVTSVSVTRSTVSASAVVGTSSQSGVGGVSSTATLSTSESNLANDLTTLTATIHSTGNFSEAIGTHGHVLSGTISQAVTERDNASGAATSTESMSHSASSSATSNLNQVSTSETESSTGSSATTVTLTDASTLFSLQNSSLSLTTDEVIVSGSDWSSLSHSLTETDNISGHASQRLYGTITNSSNNGGISSTASANSSNTLSSTLEGSAHARQTGEATAWTSLGNAGYVDSGDHDRFQEESRTGTLTQTQTQNATISGLSTLSTSNGGISSVLGSSVGQVALKSVTDTMVNTSTESSTQSMDLGSNGTILNGTQSSGGSSHSTGQSNRSETDTDTSSTTQTQSGQVGATTISRAGNSQGILTTTATGMGTNTLTLAHASNATLGLSGAILTGFVSDSSSVTTSASETISYSGNTTINATDHQTDSAASNHSTLHTTIARTDTLVGHGENHPNQNAAEWTTLTLGATGSVVDGRSGQTASQMVNLTSTSTIRGPVRTTITAFSTIANGGDTTETTLSSTETDSPTLTLESTFGSTAHAGHELTLGALAVVSEGRSSFSSSESSTDTSTSILSGTESHSSIRNERLVGSTPLSVYSNASGSGTVQSSGTTTLSASSSSSTSLNLSLNATIVDGTRHANNSSAQTGGSNTTLVGSNARVLSYNGAAGSSSTFSTTYTDSNSAWNSFGFSHDGTQTLGAAGLITGGTITSTESTTATHTQSDIEANWVGISAGSATLTGPYQWSSSGFDNLDESESSTVTLGANGTITSGVSTLAGTMTLSASQSLVESGSISVSDLAASGAVYSTFNKTQSSTHSARNQDRRTLTLGLNSTIAGGTSTFTIDQDARQNQSIGATGGSYNESSNDTSTFSFHDVGTETLGAAGVVIGGHDTYDWSQSAGNTVSLQMSNAGTITYFLNFNTTVNDTFSDHGVNTLGTMGSIVGGSDTYTWTKFTAQNHSITFLGTPTTSEWLSLYLFGHDSYTLSDTGSSTVAPTGNSSTDHYSWWESSNDSATNVHYKIGSPFPGATGIPAPDNPTNYSFLQGSGDASYINQCEGVAIKSGTHTSISETYTISNYHGYNGAIETNSWSTDANGTSMLVQLQDVFVQSAVFHQYGARQVSDGVTLSEFASFHQSVNVGDLFQIIYEAESDYLKTYSENYAHSLEETGGLAKSTAGTSFWLTHVEAEDIHGAGGGFGPLPAGPFSGWFQDHSSISYELSGPPLGTVAAFSTHTSDSDGFAGDPSPRGMAWVQSELAGQLFGNYRNTGNSGYPVGQYGNFLGPNGAVHEGTPPGGAASGTFGLMGALGSRSGHDLATGPQMWAKLNTTVGTVGVQDGHGDYQSHPSQVGYDRASTNTLAEVPGAGNSTPEATPSQLQGALAPGGAIARQQGGVAKAGPPSSGQRPVPVPGPLNSNRMVDEEGNEPSKQQLAELTRGQWPDIGPRMGLLDELAYDMFGDLLMMAQAPVTSAVYGGAGLVQGSANLLNSASDFVRPYLALAYNAEAWAHNQLPAEWRGNESWSYLDVFAGNSWAKDLVQIDGIPVQTDATYRQSKLAGTIALSALSMAGGAKQASSAGPALLGVLAGESPALAAGVSVSGTQVMGGVIAAGGFAGGFLAMMEATGGGAPKPAPTAPSTQKGWKVGDPINNLTAKGRIPTWSAVKQRFWKNEAHFNAANYSETNLVRMRRGLAPQRVNPRNGRLESMELHHIPPKREGGLFDVRPVWPEDHALIDPFRNTGSK